MTDCPVHRFGFPPAAPAQAIQEAPHEQRQPLPDLDYSPRIGHGPLGPRIARRTLRVILEEHGAQGLADTAELLASELATNAYRHSAGPSTMRVRRDAGGRPLRVGVWDTNPALPALLGTAPLPEGSANAESGRGLSLVRMCADDWGGFTLGERPYGVGGKVVWFELG